MDDVTLRGQTLLDEIVVSSLGVGLPVLYVVVANRGGVYRDTAQAVLVWFNE